MHNITKIAINMIEAYKKGWKYSLKIKARGNRKDFCYFFLVDILIILCFYLILLITPNIFTIGLFFIYLFSGILARISIIIRRFRDIGYQADILWIAIPTVFLTNLWWFRISIGILMVISLLVPNEETQNNKLTNSKVFPNIKLIIYWLFTIFFVIGLTSRLFIRENTQKSQSIIKYDSFINSVENGKVSRIFVEKDDFAQIIMKDGPIQTLSIKENNPIFLETIFKNKIDIASSDNSKYCDVPRTKDLMKNRISYGLFIDKITLGEIYTVDIYCKHYVIIGGQTKNIDQPIIFYSDIPQIAGVIEDLRKRLKSSNIEYNQYTIKE
tara:strand:+ start:1160 stop:2137 length:978 start_codon:yes stop_codon:yes gene_type:complete